MFFLPSASFVHFTFSISIMPSLLIQRTMKCRVVLVMFAYIVANLNSIFRRVLCGFSKFVLVVRCRLVIRISRFLLPLCWTPLPEMFQLVSPFKFLRYLIADIIFFIIFLSINGIVPRIKNSFGTVCRRLAATDK